MKYTGVQKFLYTIEMIHFFQHKTYNVKTTNELVTLNDVKWGNNNRISHFKYKLQSVSKLWRK